MGLTFHNPAFLWLLILIPAYLFFYWKQQKGVAVRFSAIGTLKKIAPSPSLLFRHSVAFLRCGAIFLLVIALARPQHGIRETRITTEGIDIILTVDVSGSMNIDDFKWGGKRHSRLATAKEVIKKFIEGRASDRIGMMVFATLPYTQCPLTVDYSVLLQLLDKVKIGIVDDKQTAIGTAIATSLNRLRDAKAKSKVIVLLTDGVNNAGKVDPLTAAEMAKTMDIKIYTIGVGTKSYIIRDNWGRPVDLAKLHPLDEESLKKIARVTGGKYFRATDTKSLEEIFREIDQLEKTPVEMSIYTEYNELFPYFIFPGFLLLLAGVVLAATRFRRLP